jgi:hypothetical protein
MSTDPKRGDRSHGEDYPGPSQTDGPAKHYDAPPAEPDEQREPDSATKPKPKPKPKP